MLVFENMLYEVYKVNNVYPVAIDVAFEKYTLLIFGVSATGITFVHFNETPFRTFRQITNNMLPHNSYTIIYYTNCND